APAAARRAARRDAVGDLAPRADTGPAQRRGAARSRPHRSRDRRAARGRRARGGAVTHVRRVWGIGSPRTLRPHWMLHELGLDYETRAILPRSAEMDDPELRGFTQRRKVPFFEDGEVKIGESGAITFYLADRYRDRAQLAPDPGTAERAAFEELAFFILMELVAPGVRPCDAGELPARGARGARGPALAPHAKQFLEEPHHRIARRPVRDRGLLAGLLGLEAIGAFPAGTAGFAGRRAGQEPLVLAPAEEAGAQAGGFVHRHALEAGRLREL